MSFVTLEQYLSMPREPETWIVENVLSVGGSAILYGRPKVGKSFAALGLAIAISQGHPAWLDFPVHTHGHVAYVQLDVGGPLWHRTYILPNVVFFHDRSTFHLVDRDMAPFPFNIFAGGGEWLEHALATLSPRPTLVIIDTIRRIHIGDENDSGHMQNVMSVLSKIVYPSALLMVSHARKNSFQMSENVLDDNRGSSAVTAAVDTIMKVSSDAPKVRGRLLFEGRTDSGERDLRRHASGLWLPQENHERVIREVLAANPFMSQNSQAELVASRLAISHRTAVRKIQDFKGKN